MELNRSYLELDYATYLWFISNSELEDCETDYTRRRQTAHKV